MTNPILIAGDDIEIFSELEAAEKYLEPPDVGNVSVFDRDGRPIKVLLGKRLGNDVVRLEYDPSASPQSADLRAHLISFISARQALGDQDGLSLTELWERASLHLPR